MQIENEEKSYWRYREASSLLEVGFLEYYTFCIFFPKIWVLSEIFI